MFSGITSQCSGDDTWYTDFCPTTTPISWTIIVSLAAYLISFAAGISSYLRTIDIIVTRNCSHTLDSKCRDLPSLGQISLHFNSNCYKLVQNNVKSNWAFYRKPILSRTFNLIIAMTFLFLTSWLTRAGAFFLYCGLGLLGWIIFFLFLPETSGKSLEEMEQLFSGKLLMIKSRSWFK